MTRNTRLGIVSYSSEESGWCMLKRKKGKITIHGCSQFNDRITLSSALRVEIKVGGGSMSHQKKCESYLGNEECVKSIVL